MIELTAQQIDSITGHAEADYRHECGGLLGGSLDEQKNKTDVETPRIPGTDWSRHITGEILNINGGTVLCG